MVVVFQQLPPQRKDIARQLSPRKPGDQVMKNVSTDSVKLELSLKGAGKLVLLPRYQHIHIICVCSTQQLHVMTIFYITRHHGALDWLNRQEFPVDIILSHLDLSMIKPGDVVIGLLPVHLAAAVCDAGAEYWHLSMELPYEARGTELTAQEMEAYGARLEQFTVMPKKL